MVDAQSDAPETTPSVPGLAPTLTRTESVAQAAKINFGHYADGVLVRLRQKKAGASKRGFRWLRFENRPLELNELALDYAGRDWDSLDVRDQAQILRRELQLPIYAFEPCSWKSKQWDIFVCMCMIQVIVVVPLEVAFLPIAVNSLFWMNRCMDAVFGIDMWIQCLTKRSQYRPGIGNIRIISARSLLKLYLKGWFLLDLISVVPVDIVLLATGWKFQVETWGPLRLLRLLRLTRSLRLYHKWRTHIAKKRIAMGSVVVLVLLLVAVHSIACVWGFMSSMQGCQNPSWLTRTPMLPSFDHCSIFHAYSRSVYFAVNTVFLLGSGHRRLHTRQEVVVSVFCSVACVVLWVFLVTWGCSLLAYRPVTRTMYDRLEATNWSMRQGGLSVEAKVLVRTFARETVYLDWQIAGKRFLRGLSPLLEGWASKCMVSRWGRNVSYLREGSPEFLAAVYRELDCRQFDRHEPCFGLQHRLSVAVRGSVVRNNFLVERSAFFNQDFVVADLRLQESVTVVAISPVVILSMDRPSMHRLLLDFVEDSWRARVVAAKFALRRVGVLVYREQVSQVVSPTEAGQRYATLFSSLDQSHSLVLNPESSYLSVGFASLGLVPPPKRALDTRTAQMISGASPTRRRKGRTPLAGEEATTIASDGVAERGSEGGLGLVGPLGGVPESPRSDEQDGDGIEGGQLPPEDSFSRISASPTRSPARAASAKAQTGLVSSFIDPDGLSFLLSEHVEGQDWDLELEESFMDPSPVGPGSPVCTVKSADGRKEIGPPPRAVFRPTEKIMRKVVRAVEELITDTEQLSAGVNRLRRLQDEARAPPSLEAVPRELLERVAGAAAAVVESDRRHRLFEPPEVQVPGCLVW
mmetsp:Transcript_8861/g.21980  ORF Transcript_8861/g.21980 Transcript_8861/m.21980 type:complete len:862 (+) Transcript_8861:29-2614(+)